MLQKLLGHFAYISALPIYVIVHFPHFISADLPGEVGEGWLCGREMFQKFRSGDRNGIVGRKVIAIIFQNHQPERIDQPIRVVAGDDVYGFVLQGVV